MFAEDQVDTEQVEQEEDNPHREIPQWDYGTSLNPQLGNLSSPLMLRGNYLTIRTNVFTIKKIVLTSSTEHGIMAVAQPEVLQNYMFPISEILASKILLYRTSINQLMSPTHENSSHHKLLIITGPSSMKEPFQSVRCGQWLSTVAGNRQYLPSTIRDVHDNTPGNLREHLIQIYKTKNYIGLRNYHISKSFFDEKTVNSLNSILLSMRANATRYDDSMLPTLSTVESKLGLPLFRTLLVELAQYCPLAVSLSNTISPQYFSDLCCFGLLDSSFLESQLHRELVSGLSYPCGFQTDEINGYKLEKAKESMITSSASHRFLSVTKNGSVTQVETIGNHDTFCVLPIRPFLESFQECNGYTLYDENIYKLFEESLIRELETLKDQIGFGNQLKLLIDVGLSDHKDYIIKSKAVIAIIKSQSIYKNLLGFMVDSGNDYLPKNIDPVEVNPLNHRSNAYQFSNMRTKLMKIQSDKEVPNYESFIYAHALIRLISETNELKRLDLLDEATVDIAKLDYNTLAG
ncbi:hypothetical protein CANARDRAFT_27583 [[Candida] arabinofermentans NRRL YB-2248]|uniref:3-deoxy-D-arabino-heptulosonate 7-phosphate synthase n=1 Tax=[Candida] arabinofermentans NRRL YB-2248 TaxID=983967 RepID=A0A1E4T3M6_9ASCO|nr:hypothetical protein CANARDRAFT_27583 [[Candida] arabinofermentans NRRL YB-2248]